MDLAPMPVRRTLTSDISLRSSGHTVATERSLLGDIGLLSTQVDQLCSFRDGINSSSNALRKSTSPSDFYTPPNPHATTSFL